MPFLGGFKVDLLLDLLYLDLLYFLILINFYVIKLIMITIY